jgi:hypothetical protein
MDELWSRAVLVLGLLGIAVLAAWWQRRSSQRPVRNIDASSLPAGIYLFSSSACHTCETARAMLETALGDDGYTEFAWEVEPDIFTTLGVEAVPATVVVDASGRGRLYPGQPDEVLHDR